MKVDVKTTFDTDMSLIKHSLQFSGLSIFDDGLTFNWIYCRKWFAFHGGKWTECIDVSH